MYLIYNSVDGSGGSLPNPGFCIVLELASMGALGIACWLLHKE